MATDFALVHGEYISPKQMEANGVPGGHDAYCAFLKNVVTGEQKLKILDDPEVPIYVTKPQFRQNTVKKELEQKSHLDMYRTPYKAIPQTLWKALNATTYQPGQRPQFRTPPQFIPPKKMYSNPYVYGADIDMGVHIKLAYNRANGGRTSQDYNVGFFDIETDVNGTNQIILITYMAHDGETYVGILQDFFLDHTVEEVEKMWYRKVEPDLKSRLNEKGLKAYQTLPNGIHLNVRVCATEVELIKWIFAQIHRTKPDFIGIWNIDFDIPYILNRLEFRGIDPRQIFCSPEVPWRYRLCKYKPDPGKKDGHIVDRWSWLHCTAFTRWIDYMCLYGRLRKAKPREPSYKLDAIGGKEIGSGKLEFGSGETHSTMQRFHQVAYTVYNVVDVLIMWIMDHKNHDVRSMMQLIGYSTLDCFAHQSVQLKNHFYNYLDGKGCVPGTVGDRLDAPYDYLIKNKGGAVLDPSRAEIAVPALAEDDVILRASRFVCDIDVSLTILATSRSNPGRRNSLTAGTFRRRLRPQRS